MCYLTKRAAEISQKKCNVRSLAIATEELLYLHSPEGQEQSSEMDDEGTYQSMT